MAPYKLTPKQKTFAEKAEEEASRLITVIQVEECSENNVRQ